MDIRTPGSEQCPLRGTKVDRDACSSCGLLRAAGAPGTARCDAPLLVRDPLVWALERAGILG